MDSSSVARPDARGAKTQRHAEIEALLARVEAATGADRGLDARLWCAAEGQTYALTDSDGRPILYVCPAYTASLDAALALVKRVLPGVMWQVGFDPDDGSICARLVTVPPPCTHAKANHGKPPLALLAALLKALLSSEEQPSVCEQREQAAPATATPLLNTSEVDEKR